jgi:IS30 family transposase
LSHLHCTTKRTPGQHITYEERKILEYIYSRNLSSSKKNRKTQKELAAELGWSQATLSRELWRGKTVQLTTELEEYESYSADLAQLTVQRNWQNKGPDLKIGKDHALAEKIEFMLIGIEVAGIEPLRMSPEAIVMYFDKEGWPTATRLSARTIYNYVDQGVFLNVGRSDLPRKGITPKRRYRRIEKRLRPPDYKRISERPLASEERSEPGHWEMDCIESVKGDTSCLLTLVDRHTRECLIFKLGRQTQAAVLRRINGLERNMGAAAFKRKFKSITVDNGSEFLHWEKLEQSVLSKGKRTAIYYAHAYSAWERGSNENLNGFIRYFIPKGTRIKGLREQEIKVLEEFINTYPRKILGGLSARNFLQAAA